MTAYQRMLKFGSADPPKLTKNTLESVAVDTFIKYLHQLIRADVHQSHRQRDSRLTDLLLPTHGDGARTPDYSSLNGRLGCSYDHSGFRGALPARGSRWLQVVADSRSRVRILADNMDQVRRDTTNEWNSADTNVGPIPYIQSRERDAQGFSTVFINRSNPWHNDRPNVNF